MYLLYLQTNAEKTPKRQHFLVLKWRKTVTDLQLFYF